jgi:Leu/Phe-tRNA-protein transferase
MLLWFAQNRQRFTDSNKTGDTSQNSWRIDAALVVTNTTVDIYGQLNATVPIELLQNGTMLWLGQELATTKVKPIPPIPVKSFHVNQTISSVNREVQFQIEDWASRYRIPLG